MFILGDEGHYHGRFPWVTASLVVVNVLVYVAQVFLGEPFTHVRQSYEEWAAEQKK